MNYKNLEQEFSDYSKLVQIIKNLEEMVTPADIQTGIIGINQLADLTPNSTSRVEDIVVLEWKVLDNF